MAMVVWVLLGISPAQVEGQRQLSLTTLVDTYEVHIGDPIRLSLRIDHLQPQQQPLFPGDLDEQLPDHMRARRLPEPAQTGGVAAYDLRLFEVGSQTVPSLQIRIVDGSDTLALETPPVDIEVLAIRAEGEQDLRLIKPPWTIAGGIPVWIVAILGTLGILILSWIAHRVIGGRAAVVQPRVTAPTDYRREFLRIEGMGLLERGAVKLYYTHLSDVLRRFLEERLGVDALERTTQEIAVDLQFHQLLDEKLCQKILEFLQAADLVKFARADPAMAQAKAMPATGLEIVDAVTTSLESAHEQEASEEAVGPPDEQVADTEQSA